MLGGEPGAPGMQKDDSRATPDGGRILVADGDDLFRDAVCEQLRGEFTVDEADTGPAALAACRAAEHDLVILDAGLAGVDGPEVCRRMRLEGARCPVIMLEAGDGGPVADAGTSDRLVKPLRIGELLDRIRAHLGQRDADLVFVVGPWSFRPAARTLADMGGAGGTVPLTEMESAILLHLLQAGNRAVGRDELLDEVWGYGSGVTTHTLETHVYRLRRKTEPDPSRPGILRTDRGGYRLVP